MSYLLRKPQQGAAAVIVALWMGVALSCLMVLDIGNLFWQQRELQKIADLAALAGAVGDVEQACRKADGASAMENAKANGLPLAPSTDIDIQAGLWKAEGNVLESFFQAKAKPFNACHVLVQRQVPYFFIFSGIGSIQRTLTAKATAFQSSRTAKLSIRSTLAKVDSTSAPLLDLIVGALLGGSLKIDAVGWNGLLGTQINLLKFLDALAIKVGVDAGNYDQLLDTKVDIGDVLDVMLNVIKQDSKTANAAINALDEILTAVVNLPKITVKLSELLRLQSGLTDSALNTSLNLFDLIQAFLQLGNSKNAAAANIDIPLPVLLALAVRLKVIEPPQISAIGDPSKVNPLNKFDENGIFVRTAQVRLLVSVDLPSVSALTKSINAVLSVLMLLGVDLDVLPPKVRLDLNLDVGGGAANVAADRCDKGQSIDVDVSTAAATIRLGKFAESQPLAEQAVFSNTVTPQIKPLQVVEVSWLGKYLGGLGISTEIPVIANSYPQHAFDDAPSLETDISTPEANKYWKKFKAKDIVKSLKDTVAGLNILKVTPATGSSSGNLVEGVLDALVGLLAGVTAILAAVIEGLLSPLLDPLINWLLQALGISLAESEVAAQLNCGQGSQLVY